jgi:GR25 family glycosyltransferase involved in LPS biosynthesis
VRQLPHYIISLERSARRREALEAQLADLDLEYAFVNGFDGLDEGFPFPSYKHLYHPFWGNEQSFKPGAFACYLSHSLCWQAIAEGEAQHAVVLEDDVSFQAGYPEAFTGSVPKAPFDLVFINERMQRWIAASSIRQDAPLVSVSQLLCNLVRSGEFASRIRAPGADGYVVSKAGARKLMAMLHSRKICMGVDYALVFNSLRREALMQLSRAVNGCIPDALRFHMFREASLDRDIDLNSFVYNRGFLVRSGGSPSTLGHRVRLSSAIFQGDGH